MNTEAGTDVRVELTKGRQEEITGHRVHSTVNKGGALSGGRVEVLDPDHVVIPPVSLLGLKVTVDLIISLHPETTIITTEVIN